MVGNVEVRLNKSSNPVAPGMLKSHYSPGKPVIIGDIASGIANFSHQKIGIISFDKGYGGHETVILSESGDIREAAKNIFQALRYMSKADVEVILTETFPNVGLGRAINDRLQRAAVN